MDKSNAKLEENKSSLLTKENLQTGALFFLGTTAVTSAIGVLSVNYSKEGNVQQLNELIQQKNVLTKKISILMATKASTTESISKKNKQLELMQKDLQDLSYQALQYANQYNHAETEITAIQEELNQLKKKIFHANNPAKKLTFKV